jgi:4-amino-4-deoxy-L-arabinose transferase-like glycosyltransferase
VAASMKVFGVNDSAARLPLLPIAAVVAALGFFLARKYWGRDKAWMPLLIMVTCVGFFMGMAFLLTDNFLVLWFSLTCVLLYEACQRDVSSKQRWLLTLLAAVAVVLGFLSKGLVAVILPAGVIFLWLLWERNWKWLFHGSIPVAILLFLVLLTPVMLWIEKYNPDFFRIFVVEEHFSRFTGTREIQGHPEPFWFYVPIVPLLMLPWTLFLVRMIRNMKRAHALRDDSLTRFLVLWAVVVVGFFSVSSGKLISYIMPALIPFGLLLGRWGVAEPLDGTRTDEKLWKLGVSLVPVMGVVLIALWIISFHNLIPEDLSRPAPITLLFFVPAAVLMFLMLCIKTFRCWPGYVLLLSFVFLGFTVLMSPLGGRDFNGRLNSSCAIYKALGERLQPEDEVMMFDHYRPSFAFYINRVPWLYQVTNEMGWGIKQEPDRPGFLADRNAFFRVAKDTKGRWFAMLKRDDLYELDERGLRYDKRFVAEDPERVIVELKR